LKKIKVIGCGNILAFDEGVGIHIARRLRSEILPEWIKIEELSNPGQMLPELIIGSDKLLIIDACRNEGFIRRYARGNGDIKSILSDTIHAVHLSPMFELKDKKYAKKLPEEVVVFGVKISEERKKFGVGLSNEVFASLDNTINAVLQELY